MGVFTPVELEWKEQIFTVKPHKVMGMIAAIEDVITLPELQAHCLRGSPPMGKLSMAYGVALRYAGARVTNDEVYDFAFSSSQSQLSVMQAAMGLMKMMLPPAARARLEAAEAEGEVETEALNSGNSKATAPASSKKLTKRRSQKANG